METIIAALVSAGAAILVCVINHNKTVALMEFKIDQLTQQVKKHNNLIERMYKVEEQTNIQEEKIKVANHRIDDLERSKA